MRHSSLGIALKLGATLAFSLMYAVIKLAGHFPVGEVIFFRASFALVPLFAVASFTVGPLSAIKTARPAFHLVRSIAGVSSMFLSFAALQRLPLADITAFGFVMPVFAVILAALALNERVGPYRWGAVAIGFLGVLLMIEPHGGVLHLIQAGFTSGATLALMAAFLSALVVVFIRQMSLTERSETIVFYFMVTCGAAGAATMTWNFALPGPAALTWLILSGILGGIGQICMTYSYRYAEPSLLAPFDYAAMVWAVLLGYFVLGEVPRPLVLAGAGVVVAAGVFIAWRERKTQRRKEIEAHAVPLEATD